MIKVHVRNIKLNIQTCRKNSKKDQNELLFGVRLLMDFNFYFEKVTACSYFLTDSFNGSYNDGLRY